LLAAQPAVAGLLMWYPFDEGTGSAVHDASVNGNNLAAQGAGFSWNTKAGAPFGGSIYFDGSALAVATKAESEVEAHTIDSLRAVTSNKCTIAYWTNPDAESQDAPPFGFSRGDLTRVVQTHLLQAGSCKFDIGYPGSGSGYYRNELSTTAPVGSWTHWAFVFDGSLSSQAMKIYRNGVQVASGDSGAGGAIDWAQIALVGLGGSQRYAAPWTGALDDFAVWDEALTASQISSIMSSGIASLAAPIIDEFKASPGNVNAGGAVTLSWKTRLGGVLFIVPLGTVMGPDGSIVVHPSATTTYRLTASNGGATSTRDVIVGVNEPELSPEITEFLADNKFGLSDEDGEKSDWIEIRNPNVFAISLNGWRLADSGATWVFPGVQLEPREYLVVFASDKNRRDPAAPLHTNFKLGSDGETLALKRPDGTTARTFEFPAQRTDISCAVDADGVAAFFPVPTPGAANGASVAGFVEEPAFSVTRGFFTTTQSVTINSATSGATIRYTTDKSTPSEANGIVYTGPVTVSGTTILRACAFKSGMLSSATVTESYLFPADILGQVYASNAAPPGWPVPGASTLNGQVMRYGFNSSVKARFTTQQLIDGLREIPTISIVTDQANLTGEATGIYSNAFYEGIDWERPASAEYINADGTPGFQINCGLRIRGGYSRYSSYAKHGFRLFFRSVYGKGSLNFPLHTSGTTEFESIDLRTEQNYHYANDPSGSQNTAVHEVFCRDLQTLVGKPTTRSRAVQLYVNGQYWGLYQTEERAQQDYGADYFGGSSDDYDVVQTAGVSNNYYYEMSNGTADAWLQTWTLARACAANPTNENYFKLLGRNAAGVRDAALPVYIDPDGLAGSMLLYYYIGDGDAVVSQFRGDVEANNWRGMRDRVSGGPWIFFFRDCEHAIQRSGWVDQRVSRYVSSLSHANRSNFLFSNPEWIFEDLAANPEFKLKIADVAQKYFLNAGPLSGPLPTTILNYRIAEIDRAIIPDMARWGQGASTQSYAQWLSQVSNISSNFIPGRAASIIAQLKERGFYPSVPPPFFSRRGGRVEAGYQLTLSTPGQTGTTYVTTDGSDPRAIGGAPAGQAYTAPIVINAYTQVRTRFRSSAGEWSALDEAAFSVAPPAAAGNLVVSKFDYHPVDATTDEVAAGYTGTDFEYIELLNISGDDVNLRDVQITTGVTFSFADSAIRTLAPGGRVLVVGNVAGFESRHGTGLPVAGAFSGNLNNSGELVRVAGTNGQIVQFTYDDIAPWPVEADGEGFALVLKNPSSNPDPNVAANWRVSHQPGGKPGAEDPTRVVVWRNAHFSTDDLADPSKEVTVWGDAADPDRDGLPNLMEFGLDGDPNAGAATVRPVVDMAAGKLTLTYTRSKAAIEEVAFTAVCSGEAGGPWTSAGVTEEILSDNGATQTVRASVDASGAKKFLRLRVTRL
jgi:hypothetical protein